VRRAALAALLGGALVACASGPEGDPGSTGSEAAERVIPPVSAKVWFAARTAPCDRAIDALAHFAGQPGVSAPQSVRPRESSPWCALAGREKRGVRADSWAQNVSSMLKVPAIAFYVADGAWSYAVFDSGEPVCAMESHFGDPVVVGQLERCARALGTDAQRLAGYRLQAKQVAAHRDLAVRLGFDYPMPDVPSVAVRPIPSADAPKPVKVEAPKLKPFEKGQWVVMPPLGVMLIKSIEPGGPAAGGGEPAYVVVAGDRTLKVPVVRAATMGMRAIVSAKAADEVLARLAEEADVEDTRRYDEGRARGWLDALKRGDLQAIADAHQELCAIQGDRDLYSIEAGMLETVRGWLIDELSTAKNVQGHEIEAALVAACD